MPLYLHWFAASRVDSTIMYSVQHKNSHALMCYSAISTTLSSISFTKQNNILLQTSLTKCTDICFVWKQIWSQLVKNCNKLLSLRSTEEIHVHGITQTTEHVNPEHELTSWWRMMLLLSRELLQGQLVVEFNVPFQHKYGYIRDKRSGGELSPPSEGRPVIY